MLKTTETEILDCKDIEFKAVKSLTIENTSSENVTVSVGYKVGSFVNILFDNVVTASEKLELIQENEILHLEENCFLVGTASKENAIEIKVVENG